MMLTSWHMSVRMDPDLDPKVMAALADALVPLFNEEANCAIYFATIMLQHDDRTDIEALQKNFSPRAVGFAPIGAPALSRLLREIHFVETLEIRFFSLDAGRIAIHVHGADLSITAENPHTLMALTKAVMATEEDFDLYWRDDPITDDPAAPTTPHDDLLNQRRLYGS